MESTNNNLQYHHPQHPLEASSLSPPSSYAHVGGTNHSWTPNITLNAGSNFNQNFQEADPTSRESMIQDLGYHYQWASKEEISIFPPKFSEILNTPSTAQMKSEQRDMNEKKLLHSAQSYYPNLSGTTSRGNFSQIYPSISISPTYSTSVSSSFGMSTQSLDLLTPTGSFSAGLSQHSQDDHDLGAFSDHNLSFSLHHMQHPNHRSSCSNTTNIQPSSHFTNGGAEAKRPGTLMESMVCESQTASKKSRLDSSRPPCPPPLKVRKEKLGDRIAALQQLVAPFGKTDTASVLMEAIGYIKFLQGQVETLSVPYMKKPSQNHTNRTMQGGTATDEADGETTQDLRSRGLCLVPLSCMSYIAGDCIISEVWQQPNFGRAT
ncbi:transcription factor bHLH110-like isoform X2 [Lotus japonicus]|uniref:transcription factor bHLH110-like isoform X2 n=1 Tax=Lotus japonicus TaxID=34305 RepID=UPI00258A2DC5|nr:transcription factor bHLH110-like isoform X2 [Lotus japonicus]